jgi:serine/threonine protein kinase/tetratricopeptide (TPR) repeat protein
VGGDPRKDAEGETIASGDRIEATVETGPAPSADHPTLAEVSPDHYRVEGEFARGGMGRILLALDRRLGRRIALKELHADAGPGAPRRFVREALVTARLQHPAIVPVYEAGYWPGGQPFYAMKLVEGRSLDALLRDALSLASRLALLPHLIAVAEAVAYAHGQRVVHRDLKPANVLVGSFGETVVVDWGLARELGEGGTVEREADGAGGAEAAALGQTVTGTVLGTPHYMPPEQARGLPVDERADVYALGAMLYFLLTGAPPHAGKSAAEALAAAADGSIEPVERREPEAPPDLVAIVGKAMAPSPAERYPTAQELAADLRRFQTGQLVSAYRYSTRELLRRFVVRHRAAVIVASALTAALVVAVVTGFVAVRRQARVAEAERDRARLAARKAEQTNAFVVGMLGSADPRNAGRDVTVASVLDAASARVESELAGQPDVKAEVLKTLGTTYEGLGLYAPAKERLQAALDASRAAFGPDHVEVARVLDRLAAAFEDEGDLQEAERLDRDALAMLGRLGETGGKDSAQVKGDLARVLRGLGQGVEAEALYREVLAIERQVYGDRSAPVATTLNNLGVLLGQRGDWAAAEPLHREALDIVRAALGPEHPDVAAAMGTLGNVLEAKGDLAGAEALYRDSLALRLKILGPEHPEVAHSRYTLASLLRAKGDAEGAVRECRQVLALRGRVLPDTHPMVAATQQVMGLALLDLGRPREAEPLLRESLELRRQSLPPGHWLISSSESMLGACLTAEGRYAEAEALLLRAHAGLESSRGHDHERTIEARRRLVALYEVWGRPDRAAAWRGTSR